MNYKLKQLDRNIKVVCVDSAEHDITKNNWLPEGLMSTIWGKVIQFFNKYLVVMDKLGKWMAFELINYKKIILIIIIYQITNRTGGVYSILNQYNQGDGNSKVLALTEKKY